MERVGFKFKTAAAHMLTGSSKLVGKVGFKRSFPQRYVTARIPTRNPRENYNKPWVLPYRITVASAK